MTPTTLALKSAARARATGELHEAVYQLVARLKHDLAGQTATAVLYFASIHYDETALSEELAAHFPQARVIGCSTAGEFTDTMTGVRGITAIALPATMVKRAVAGIADLERGVGEAVGSLVQEIEAGLGRPLRELDPARYLGFVLIDGVHGAEEEVNELLGNAAPLLDVVGGSAGDDLTFDSTWVAADGVASRRGVALIVCETSAPFQVVKTCSFAPSGQVLTITKADAVHRVVLEFDGRPAAQAYAAALGVPEASLTSIWMRHPTGLMIDGQPWLRSPQALLPDGAIRFYAQILEGMEVDVMNPTDLVGETAAAMAQARARLDGHAGGAVLFNCILRRLEMDAESLGEQFIGALGGIPTAGFHSYGESWLGHVNQTLTGVVFGG